MPRRRRTRGPGPLVFSLLLLALLLLLLVIPPLPSRGGRLRPLGAFDAEPEVRVLLATLGPGDSLEVAGAAVPGGEPLPDGRLAFDGRRAALAGALLALPSALEAVDGTLKIEGRDHPGRLELVADGSRMLAVVVVPLETYIEGVVMAEMGERFADEALIAQAVCARSYAANRMLARRGRSHHLKADQSAQVYRGRPRAAAHARRIVDACRGVVLAHDGTVLPAYYSSTCGGATRPAAEAFGGRAPAPLDGAACGFCDGTPHFRWKATLPMHEAAKALGVPPEDLAAARLGRLPSGRLGALEVPSGDGAVRIGSSRLRRAVGPAMRSTWVTSVARRGGDLVVEGRGFGHGVGLCQYGAATMAEAGFDARAILARYFPGADLALLYP